MFVQIVLTAEPQLAHSTRKRLQLVVFWVRIVTGEMSLKAFQSLEHGQHAEVTLVFAMLVLDVVEELSFGAKAEITLIAREPISLGNDGRLMAGLVAVVFAF